MVAILSQKGAEDLIEGTRYVMSTSQALKSCLLYFGHFGNTHVDQSITQEVLS